MGQDILQVLVLSPSSMLLLWLSESVKGRSCTKTAGGARRVRGDKVRREASHGRAGRAAVAARVVVLNEVIVIVITHLEGEDEGVCAVRISGEGVEPTHHPGDE